MATAKQIAANRANALHLKISGDAVEQRMQLFMQVG
jgi:hypothetical protein